MSEEEIKEVLDDMIQQDQSDNDCFVMSDYYKPYFNYKAYFTENKQGDLTGYKIVFMKQGVLPSRDAIYLAKYNNVFVDNDAFMKTKDENEVYTISKTFKAGVEYITK